MTTLNDRINTRIDPALKRSAEGIFAQLGISTSEAIRMFYAQVILHHGLPFPLRIPNADTLASFKETENPENLKSYESTKELFESWDQLAGEE